MQRDGKLYWVEAIRILQFLIKLLLSACWALIITFLVPYLLFTFSCLSLLLYGIYGHHFMASASEIAWGMGVLVEHEDFSPSLFFLSFHTVSPHTLLL